MSQAIAKFRAQSLRADVLLVTVTKVEAQAVLTIIEQEHGHECERHHIDPKTYYDLGVIGGARVFMARSEMGAGGPGGAQSTVQAGIQALSPSAVIMVGIAFGVDPQKQSIGDILVSHQLQPYELQRIGTGSDGQVIITDRGECVRAPTRLLDRFRDGEISWQGANVKFGLALSGQKLIDNLEFRNNLRRRWPEAIGGEMEGAGLYAAASMAKVDWILVKAICDWADGKKHEHKSQRQKEAAQNAANFTIHVIKRGGFSRVSKEPKLTFHLPFANREAEKKLIRTLLESDFYVQIYAPGGLGKTYVLNEIKREMEAVGWQTVGIDLASELHRSIRADHYGFLQAFSQQIWGETASQINTLDKTRALRQVGRKLANSDQEVILFLDNADWGDMRLLNWIRETFLETFATLEVPIRVLASGQQIIPEWRGMKRGRPFKQLPLSEFDDPKVVQEIIDYVIAHFGAKRAKARRTRQDEAWHTTLQTMVNGLLQISCGHPLIMAEVLCYAADENGLMHATFFTDKWAELCDRCLAPIVGGRILPTVDNIIREAFRTLCIFRYVWLALINTLTNPTTPSDLWERFSTSGKSGLYWWSNLQETHLIHDANTRQMHPISPVIRQVIAQVLQAEDESLYRTRNRYARQQYEELLISAVPAPQRAAYLLELFYHATQDGTLSRAEAANVFKKKLNDLLNGLGESSLEVASQLKGWLREDTELQAAINQLAGRGLYVQLIETIDNFIKRGKVDNHE